MSGLAIFFNALYTVDPQKEYLIICNAIEKELFTYTDEMCERNEGIENESSGAFGGEASIMYTYEVLYKITNKEKYLDYAKKHYKILKKAITRDNSFDLVYGNAGAVITLINMYQLTGNKEYIASAEIAGDIIVNAQEKEGSIKGGWNGDGRTSPLAGFSHGASGIVLALAKLWQVTQKEEYLLSLLDGIKFENSLFVKEKGNWKDERVYAGEKASVATKQKILIVDDDENIAELISLYLTKECFETKIVYDGESALLQLDTFRPNLILLDLMLPGIDGYQVCREIRKSNNVPIIMLSAKGETFDKVLGLELGADDYIIKPFETKELVARVKAVLRRYQLPAESAPVGATVQCVEYPDLIINLSNYSVQYCGKNVEMPPKELELLYFLASSPNQVFTREQLLDHIWGYEYIGDTRTVDVHIKRIREKIKDHANWSIETVWGIGYKFVTRR